VEEVLDSVLGRQETKSPLVDRLDCSNRHLQSPVPLRGPPREPLSIGRLARLAAANGPSQTAKDSPSLPHRRSSAELAPGGSAHETAPS
jgi:hypothetical protein